MTQITSLEELKELASSGTNEFFIILNGGFKSSKDIYYEDEIWEIRNHIDDSIQVLESDTKLKNNTLIVEAIEKGALYSY